MTDEPVEPGRGRTDPTAPPVGGPPVDPLTDTGRHALIEPIRPVRAPDVESQTAEGADAGTE
uniref:hypothetical protein n=1 Tax=Pseudonocardia pini TaxID=2758030 RepID=UPI001C68EA60